MGDTIQFVDSIASSPTVLLDLNDLDTVGSGFGCRVISCPPPRLRRSISQNAMRDGIYVSASNYEARTIVLELDMRASSQDNLATEWQTLARIVNGETSILKYQPTGATSPVFFNVYRSEVPALEDVLASAAFRKPTLELLAEPFALGIRETVSVGTVNNDPAAGSNGCYFDVSSIKGDVAAPIVLGDTVGQDGQLLIAVRQRGTPTNLPVFAQAESLTLGTDTTNPGGGPDANMSGTGTNNYVRTSFATVATMTTRITYTAPSSAVRQALTGSFRCLAVVRRSGSANTITAQATADGVAGATVTIPLSTSRQVIDLGIVTFGDRRGGTTPAEPLASVAISAARASGAETLDWDCIHLVPADESLAIITRTDVSADIMVDGMRDRVAHVADAANLYNGTTEQGREPCGLAGSIPRLLPGVTNRFFFLKYGATSPYTIAKSSTASVNIFYHPAYLHVRPAST